MPTKKLTMTRQVFDQIRNTIGRCHPESGGILGSSDGGKTIDHFYFDSTARTTGGTYSPDTAVLNRILKEWNDKGITLEGFVHSHPWGHTAPSTEDIKYAKRIMEALS